MTRPLKTYLLGLSVLAGALASLLLHPTPALAVVNNHPGCDNVAVIRCGAFDADTLRVKASQNDAPRIYNALGISQNDLRGNFVDGVVWRDGRVTVNGEVVATGAMTAGRNFGGSPIAGTNADIYPASRFTTEGQTAFVRMKNGAFDFAVIKSCGNPVTATPAQFPTPQTPIPPQLSRGIRVCDLRNFQIVTIRDVDFDSTWYTRDLNTCRPIRVCSLVTMSIIEIRPDIFDEMLHSRNLSDCRETPAPTPVPVQSTMRVCEFATRNIVEIRSGEFDSTRYSRNLSDCRETPAPSRARVCDLTTQSIIEIRPGEFDATRHSRDLSDCRQALPTSSTIQACELATQNIVEITETEFDSTRHSRDLSACTQEKATAPEMLAITGPEAIVTGLFGSGALGYGTYSYFRSRHNLLNKLLGR